MVAPPREIVPVLLFIAAIGGSLFLFLDSLGDKAQEKPWKWGDTPRRQTRAAQVKFIEQLQRFS